MTHPQLARPTRRRRWHRDQTVDWAKPVLVTVAWTSEDDVGAPQRSQLEVELSTSPSQSELSWLDRLAAARCNEIVLTAPVGNNGSAQHLVLELAERLTLELTATQPLIRVLFQAEPPALESRSLSRSPFYEDLSAIGAI